MEEEVESRENRASEEFMDHKAILAEEEKRRFTNMRETVLDIVVDLERNHPEMKFAKRLKKRALMARSEVECRLIMDGLLVIAGFNVKQVYD